MKVRITTFCMHIHMVNRDKHIYRVAKWTKSLRMIRPVNVAASRVIGSHPAMGGSFVKQMATVC